MASMFMVLLLSIPQLAIAEQQACASQFYSLDAQRTGLQLRLITHEEPKNWLGRQKRSAHIEIEYHLTLPAYLRKRLPTHTISVYHLPIDSDVDVEDRIVDPLIALLEMEPLFEGPQAPFRRVNYRGQIVEVNSDQTQLRLQTRLMLITKNDPIVAHKELLERIESHLILNLPHLFEKDDWSGVQNGFMTEIGGKVTVRTPVGNFPLQLTLK